MVLCHNTGRDTVQNPAACPYFTYKYDCIVLCNIVLLDCVIYFFSSFHFWIRKAYHCTFHLHLIIIDKAPYVAFWFRQVNGTLLGQVDWNYKILTSDKKSFYFSPHIKYRKKKKKKKVTLDVSWKVSAIGEKRFNVFRNYIQGRTC